MKKITERIRQLFPDTDSQCFAALCLLAVFWIVPGIFQGELLAGDETRVAGIAAEMARSGDWIVPRLNGIIFLEYPPLYYQFTAIFFRLFGFCDAAAGVPSCLAALGSAFLLYFLVKECKRPSIEALTASVFLMASSQFFVNARYCRVDILLTFFIILSAFGFLRWFRAERENRISVSGILLLIAGVAGGIMSKGLIGAVIPAAGIGSFFIADDLLNRRFRRFRYYTMFGCFSAALIPLIIYSCFLYSRCGEEAVYTLDYVNGIGRFSGSQGDHISPWYWYIIHLPEYFLPWLPLSLIGLYTACRRIRTKKEFLPEDVMIFLILLPFLLMSCAAGKRQVYLLPLTPFCALYAVDGAKWLFTRKRLAFVQPYMRWNVMLPGFLLAAMIANAADAAYTRHEAKQDSLRRLFQKAEEISRAENRPIKLYAPAERLAGAAYFYRGCITPVIRGNQRSMHEPKELWIARRPVFKHTGKEYADRYFLIRYPEEFQSFR